jgi:hypothetical protein
VLRGDKKHSVGATKKLGGYFTVILVKAKDKTFKILKEILTTKPVLLIPDLSKPFRIHAEMRRELELCCYKRMM